ncbi:MAG: hypothetical protein HC806_08980, partial [Anaerolineae bacterium]|nr:hypothetical protein [Anaerolineae bacterium]
MKRFIPIILIGLILIVIIAFRGNDPDQLQSNSFSPPTRHHWLRAAEGPLPIISVDQG